ncbi:protein phosphatase 2C domain-containing protein [Micromonospora sp. WMMD712]|uniref:protein phosphatase 2C domain-containing protein n=1 Tax=Micromonospora sp. WMMD712 TaxID=3016096 RepID=UPI002499F0CE|nr:protein phosphatase 2C domain-containing protein [Micromonospora sp. WMMD712]WFE59404.1 protein phosphatase 2C domain-containing protein [Micromonospora sp. WMMD712]
MADLVVVTTALLVLAGSALLAAVLLRHRFGVGPAHLGSRLWWWVADRLAGIRSARAASPSRGGSEAPPPGPPPPHDDGVFRASGVRLAVLAEADDAYPPGGGDPVPWSAGGTVAPPRPVDERPAVHRLLVAPPRSGREAEPRLPARVVAGGGWHSSLFHGWCGTAEGPRPTVRLVVRAATLRGATHAGLGTEGQDAVGAAWDEGRSALYLAVADGLGSLPRSGRVAAEAVNAALHLCASRPEGITFAGNGERLFGAIADGMVRALPEGVRLDGACTLVVAEVLPRFDGAQVTVHGVGDSEAWALYADRWEPIHHERGGADNATRDVPTHVRPLTHTYDLPPGAVLLLGSDGFAGALDTTVSPLARQLAREWRTPPSWLDFVNHVGFVDDYWADDRSAAAVWIGEGAGDEQ